MNESQLYHIAQLEQQKANFLALNPHMQTIQDKIDQTLEEVGKDPLERCRTLSLIMLQSLSELGNNLGELQKYVEESGIKEHLSELTTAIKKFDTKN